MQKETTYPGLYVAKDSDARAIVPGLCARGYYVILLRERSDENEAYFGRCYYDYSDAAITCCTPGLSKAAIYMKSSLQCRWIVAFRSGLFEETPSEKEISDYTFFTYYPEEALHLSTAEIEVIAGCINDIRIELQRPGDHYSSSILAKHIHRLLDYITRFYERQFITRELANDSILVRYEALISRYMAGGNLQTQGLPDIIHCAKALCLSETYLNDLLRFKTGCAHDCYVELKRIEIAKKRLAGSSDSIHRIAAELGFPSASYFSYLFKKLTGTAPNNYKLLN